MLKKILTFIGVLMFCVAFGLAVKTQADELDCDIISSDGYSTWDLQDDDFNTSDYFRTDTTLTVRTDEPMYGLYVRWDSLPGEWTLTVNDKDYTYGTHDFLHEYVELPEPSTEAIITITTDYTYVTDIYAFGEGELPSWVQVWEDPYDRADILLFSTHADDECLFFGGIIPNYCNEDRARVQVTYFADHTMDGQGYRRHEQLNGLWKMGIDHYPEFGFVWDYYSEDLATAESQFNWDECLEHYVGLIRKYKPQVVVAQDLNGEYGHGAHMYTARLALEAVEISNNESKYTDSVAAYGVWDVPKTYLHLYGENKIELDVNTPLDDFDGMTALEVAKEGYKRHLSQQWCWFYVSDGTDGGEGSDYACNKYGLARLAEGYEADEACDDLMEHLTSYDEQERQIAEEEESKRLEEEESRKAEEEKNNKKKDETKSTDEYPEEGDEERDERGKNSLKTWKTILIIAGVVFVILLAALIIRRQIAIKRRKKRAAERRARLAEARRRAEMEEQQYRTVNRSTSTRSSNTRR